MAIHVNEDGIIQELASQSKGNMVLKHVESLNGPFTIKVENGKLAGPNLQSLIADLPHAPSINTSIYPIIEFEYDFDIKAAYIVYLRTTSSHYHRALLDNTDNLWYTLYTESDQGAMHVFVDVNVPLNMASLTSSSSIPFPSAYLYIQGAFIKDNKLYIGGNLDREAADGEHPLYLRGFILLFA